MTSNYENVEFVHSWRLGVSLAVVPTERGLAVAASFAHKPGPTGNKNVEQFSRAKGRAICVDRANAVGNEDGNPPYAKAYVARGNQIRPAAYAIKQALNGLDDSLTQIDGELILGSNTPRDQQLDNSSLFTVLTDALESELSESLKPL